MGKISSKIFVVILVCSVLTAAVLGSIVLKGGRDLAQSEAEDMLVLMSKYYSGQFGKEFDIIEEQVKELEIYIHNTLDYGQLKNDKNYLAKYEVELAKFIKSFAENRARSVSAYVFFSPEWSDTPHDVYFIDETDDKIAERQDYIDFSYLQTPATEDDKKQWWLGPQSKRGAYWTDPYEWTLKSGKTISMASYTVPIYMDNKFICIVGTDYVFDKMFNEVQQIKVYEHGYAMLLNENLDIIIHPKYVNQAENTLKNLETTQDGKYKEIAQKIKLTPFGIVPFDDNGTQSVIAYSKLANGWVLGIVPPVAEMYSGINRVFVNLFEAILICILFATVVAYSMGRFITRPILKVVSDAEKIGTGDLSVKVCVNTKDEISVLANSLNNMTTNIKKLQGDLFKQAFYDELTGLRNFVKFKLDAEQLLKNNPDVGYHMIMFDVDRFKVMNELYGFVEGDRILKNVAKTMETLYDKEHEVYGRIGSDEFVALLRRTPEAEAMNNRHLFSETFCKLNASMLNYKLTFPAGRYTIEKGETDVAAIFEKVNIAHRLAKEKNDNKFCNYDASTKQIAIKEKEIEDKMEPALENGEFLLFLQPKYRLADEKIVGAEALVRWKVEDIDIVYPGNFIALFEKNGFITKLDFYMFEKTCATIRKWLDEGVDAPTVSVNFSRLHLNNPTFLESLCEIADKYNVPRKLLEIELTETAMLDNENDLCVFLNGLHDAGFTLSMDDFGTGYSSLGLLKNLPVDVVKIDRSFFVDTIDEERTKNVLFCIIDMAKRLGIHTVAEGVELKEHVELLKNLGCDIVQGFYFARPMEELYFSEILYKMRLLTNVK